MYSEYRYLSRLFRAAFLGGVASIALSLSGCGGGDAAPASAANESSDHKLAASEHEQTSPNYMFNLWTSGSGTVTSSPAGLKCTNEHCYSYFLIGSTVTLTATPAAGAAISQWGGSCAGKATTCKIVMNYPKDVSTAFTTSTTGTPPATPPASGTSSSPLVLFTDIQSGPVSGGENNNGIYLSIFGRNFGSSLANVAVNIGGHAVARVMSLGPSRLAAASSALPIEQITVQVGALGSPTAGTALPIDVVVNGVHSNSTMTFTPLPGRIFFVAANGVDTTDTVSGGTFSAPFQTVQKPGFGLSFSIDPASVSGAYGRVRAGDFIVMRAGSYSTNGFQGYFMQTLNKSGCPINNNCAQGGGLSSGPITLMGYPGEKVQISRINTSGNGQNGGAISSADTARQQEGMGSYWTFANLVVESGLSDGPINAQRGDLNPLGGNWRVVNNELTAKTCVTNNGCLAGGISGGGNGHFWVGNYIHDLYDGPNNGSSPLEMHGIYIGYNGSYDLAYNVITNVFGGNGIQTHGSTAINNVSIHHNVIHDVGKHGINLADTTQNNIVIWNNLVYNTQCAGIRMGGTSLLKGMKLYNNVFYNTGLAGNTPSTGAVTNDMQPAAGQIDIRNNIFVPHSGSPYLAGEGDAGLSGGIGTISNNLWYGGTGTNPATTVSSSSLTSNPQFTSTTSGAENFHLLTGSPALSGGTNAVDATVADDLDNVTRATTGAFSQGPYSQ